MSYVFVRYTHCYFFARKCLTMYASVYILISLFICLSVCGCVNAAYAPDEYVCALVLTQLRAQRDNKEFVVGLECPERLELWQLQRSKFTDVALSCR